MKVNTYKAIMSGTLVLLFPMMVGCSVFSSDSKYSNDPAVAAQLDEVQALKREVKEAERLADEAEEREKAAKNRLKAAEHELKALQSRAKRESSY
ncbi:hypothetical protein [Pontibacter rugosus]|uniref:Murein lipoprotein n=1 Tax=Pontibacter rugosus TaxID=1745966 RepID=A0ABW3SKX5_9BACT